MKNLLTNTTKSARSRIALALLLVLAATGVGVVFAAQSSPDFSLTVTPSTQTVSRGASATYTVALTKSSGFNASVKLSTSNLPAGVSAQFPSGNSISGSATSAALQLTVASSAVPGSYSVTVSGVGGNLTRTTTVGLTVPGTGAQNFSLNPSPSTQTIGQGDQTSFGVAISRSGGFSGPVNLTLSGAPPQTTATWQPSQTVSGSDSGATVLLDTASSASAGTYPITITGTGTVNGAQVTRSTSASLVITKKAGLQISGDLTTPINPGETQNVDLVLTNPYNFALQVTGLSIAVQDGTGNAGCSASQNFSVKQAAASVYPISVPAGASKALSQLGVTASSMPSLSMIDQPWNQDACKNASIHLAYNGSAGK